MDLTKHLNTWLEDLADSSLERIVLENDMDVEQIKILFEQIESKTGEKIYKFCIICSHLIGFKGIGLWDENIVDAIKIEDKSDLIEDSINQIYERYEDPDKFIVHKSIRDKFYQLTIKLVDGLEIYFIASEIILKKNFKN